MYATGAIALTAWAYFFISLPAELVDQQLFVEALLQGWLDPLGGFSGTHVVVFLAPAWVSFLGIFYMRLNRFPDDQFIPLVLLLITFPILTEIAFVTDSLAIFFFADMLFLPLITLIFYSVRHNSKAKLLPYDKLKLILTALCIFVFPLFSVFFANHWDNEVLGMTLLAGINLIILMIILTLNLYHIHLRAEAAEAEELKMRIQHIGRERRS